MGLIRICAGMCEFFYRRTKVPTLHQLLKTSDTEVRIFETVRTVHRVYNKYYVNSNIWDRDVIVNATRTA